MRKKPILLESKVKPSMKVLGVNKSPGVDKILIELFQAKETESVKILTRLCQQIWKRKHSGSIEYTSQSSRKKVPRSVATIGPLL